jgi:hypothetical protein
MQQFFKVLVLLCMSFPSLFLPRLFYQSPYHMCYYSPQVAAASIFAFKEDSESWWAKPVILATQEAEIRRLTV